MSRETKSARIELRAKPSLKARAEAVADRRGQTLSDYAHDTLEAAIDREERKAARVQPA